jgi:hypothetical protein
MTDNTRQMQIFEMPRWMYFYSLALGVFGIAIGLWSVVAPMGMFDIADLTLEGTGKSLIIGLFAARNAAFGFLFLLALFKFRTWEVLMVVFTARLFLDILDTTVIIAVGQMDIIRALEQFIPFIIPLSISIYVLTKRSPYRAV